MLLSRFATNVGFSAFGYRKYTAVALKCKTLMGVQICFLHNRKAKSPEVEVYGANSIFSDSHKSTLKFNVISKFLALLKPMFFKKTREKKAVQSTKFSPDFTRS